MSTWRRRGCKLQRLVLKGCRLSRWRGAALLVASLCGGCTTSTAVLTWHEGWQAEQQGDRQRAERKYDDAARYDGNMVGAACNRVRLIAAHPDRQAEAKESLDKLLKTKGATPEVAVIGALAALGEGNVSVARKRLAASRVVKPDDSASVRAAVAVAEVQLRAAEGRWQEAAEAQLGAALPEEASAARATYALALWNAGRIDEAAGQIAGAGELAPWLAGRKADWLAVLRLLEQVPAAKLSAQQQALRAWALAQTGDVAGALGLAAAAAQRDPGQALLAEVWGAVAVAAGEFGLARDVLAGLVARSPAVGWTAWFNLGVAQVQLGELSGARLAFDRAVGLCAECAPAVKNRNALRGLEGLGAR